MLRSRSRLKPGAINPCLPELAKEPPPGSGWLHEIKHDGFRLMARRNRQAVRLYTRNGYDFGDRFPKIIEAIKSLPVRSCFIDGEVIVVNERGLSVFDLIRSGRRDRDAVLCAFDLIELDGRDLRGAPIEERKHVLANLLFREGDGISFNDLYDGDGAMIFKQACALGCEGIVSKRLGSPYRSGPFNDWLKIKNPAAPASVEALGAPGYNLRDCVRYVQRSGGPHRARAGFHSGNLNAARALHSGRGQSTAVADQLRRDKLIIADEHI